MAIQLDRIVVVDLECTCWEGNPPPNQTNDIIEIGICQIDVKQFERKEKRSLLISPTRSTISQFCTELTTITAAMVADGMTLKEGCKVLMNEFDTKKCVWASWGDFDRSQFERSCRDLKTPYPFSSRHINVKTLFALAYQLPRELGLGGAFRHLQWEMDGTHHRGDDDAWNIAKVLCHLLRRAGGTSC